MRAQGGGGHFCTTFLMVLGGCYCCCYGDERHAPAYQRLPGFLVPNGSGFCLALFYH